MKPVVLVMELVQNQAVVKKTCPKCNGRGELRYVQQSPFGQFVRVSTCDECGGTGEVIIDKCKVCTGTGKEVKNKKIKVKFQLELILVL